VTWQESAEFLGQHPTALALGLSFVVSFSLTAAIRATDVARPWLRAGFERRPKFLGERSLAAFQLVDEALVLLLLAFLGVFGGSSLFLHLVQGLRESSWLPQWDNIFVQTVHQTASPAEIAFFSAITPLAGVYPPLILGGAVGALLLARRHFMLCGVWLVGLLGNSLLINGLKRFFERPRPIFEEPLMVEPYFSFPSGHAMTSIMLYGLLAYVCSREFYRYRHGHRHLMIWTITFLGVLIGTSRLVLGVHYPSDILAGWSVSSAWLALVVLVAEILRGRFGPVDKLWGYLRATGRSAKVSLPDPSR
jgi:undecaprenyl-diphosphatase